MKHTHIENRDHGFYGAYNPGKDISNHARIIRIGDDPEDRSARSAASYLLEKGVKSYQGVLLRRTTVFIVIL